MLSILGKPLTDIFDLAKNSVCPDLAQSEHPIPLRRADQWKPRFRRHLAWCNETMCFPPLFHMNGRLKTQLKRVLVWLVPVQSLLSPWEERKNRTKKEFYWSLQVCLSVFHSQETSPPDPLLTATLVSPYLFLPLINTCLGDRCHILGWFILWFKWLSKTAYFYRLWKNRVSLYPSLIM